MPSFWIGTFAMSVSFAPLRKRHLRAIVQHDRAVRERPVGRDGNFGGGAFHRAQIAARIFDRILQAEPGGIVIRHRDLLHAGKIDHVQLVGLANCTPPAST